MVHICDDYLQPLRELIVSVMDNGKVPLESKRKIRAVFMSELRKDPTRFLQQHLDELTDDAWNQAMKDCSPKPEISKEEKEEKKIASIFSNSRGVPKEKAEMVLHVVLDNLSKCGDDQTIKAATKEGIFGDGGKTEDMMTEYHTRLRLSHDAVRKEAAE